MRGSDRLSGLPFSYVDLKDRIPARHPLLKIRQIVNDALASLDGGFDRLYSAEGRPSIAPERLLRASLIQILFSVRSERQLLEQMRYSLMFRWFVGLGIDDPVWVPTVFTKNRNRLLTTDIARKVLTAIMGNREVAPLLSDEHFSVDGTLIKAWNPGLDPPPHAGGRQGIRQRRFRRRPAADPCDPPHLARKSRHSAIDGRTTRHPGYAVSQQQRKKIEEPFGCAKTVGDMAQTMPRGARKLGATFTLTIAACNLARLPKLLAQ